MAECETEAVVFLEYGATPQPDWLGSLLASSARKKSAGPKGKVLHIESRIPASLEGEIAPILRYS